MLPLDVAVRISQHMHEQWMDCIASLGFDPLLGMKPWPGMEGEQRGYTNSSQNSDTTPDSHLGTQQTVFTHGPLKRTGGATFPRF